MVVVIIVTMLFGQNIVLADIKAEPNVLAPAPVQNLNFTQLQNGLRGDYFDSMNLTNNTNFRIDKNINFDWGSTNKPVLGLKHDYFSVRWSGFVLPSFNEVYNFTTKADDGVRLYINDTLIINDWNQHSTKEQSVNVRLIAGQPYSIRLEYFQYTGQASVKLYWSSNSQRREIIPYEHLYTPIQQNAARGTGNGLKGYYYSDKNLINLVDQRTDKNINFDWKPTNKIGKDGFGVRWIGKIQPLYSELYTFRTVSDDGIRVWINGQLLIDLWHDGSENLGVGNIQLQAGQTYDIKIEYYENNKWPANVSFYWSSQNQPLEIVPTSQLYTPPAPAAGNGTGLRAEYYGDKNLGSLKTVIIDPDINFDWGNRGLPVDGVSHNNFSVRWTGKMQPLYNETYTFKTVSDDGVRLYINGRLIIDDWTTHSSKVDTAKIDLQAGVMYDIKIEYYQETGMAGVELYWSSLSQKNEIVSQKQLYNN